MLKFLQNRTDQYAPRRPVRNKPSNTFGISLETPPQFQKQWTMISTNTFVNPYLKFQAKRKNKIPNEKIKVIQPSWTKKIDVLRIQDQAVIGSNYKPNEGANFRSLDPSKNSKSKYTISYLQQLKKSPTRFRLTKGQFSNFIQRNHRYQSLAPLQGSQRNNNKALQTKKSILRKSQQTLTYRRSTFMNNDSMGKLSTNRQKNFSPLDLKAAIRKNRDTLHHSFKRSLQQKKKNHLYQFLLPQIAIRRKRRQQMLMTLNHDSTANFTIYDKSTNNLIDHQTNALNATHNQQGNQEIPNNV